MVEFKVVISDSKGKSTSQELKDKSAQPLLGTKLGDILESSILGFKEGKIKLTGGSDKSGTPMRSDLHGATKKYVLMTRGVGMRNLAPGDSAHRAKRCKHCRSWLLQTDPRPG